MDGELRDIQAMYANNSTEENPIIEVSMYDDNWDVIKIYRVRINDIDPHNATQLEMFALCSHLDNLAGKSYLDGSSYTEGSRYELFNYADEQEFATEKKEWMEILRQNLDVNQDVSASGYWKMLLDMFDKFVENHGKHTTTETEKNGEELIEEDRLEENETTKEVILDDQIARLFEEK